MIADGPAVVAVAAAAAIADKAEEVYYVELVADWQQQQRVLQPPLSYPDFRDQNLEVSAVVRTYVGHCYWRYHCCCRHCQFAIALQVPKQVDTAED